MTCDMINRNEMNNSEDMYAILNLDHEFCYVNAAWYNWYDISSKEFDAVSKNYSSIPSKVFEHCTEKFELQDNRTALSRQPVSTFGVHYCKFHSGYRASICTTSPIIKENIVVGLEGHAQLLSKVFVRTQKQIQAAIKINQPEMVMTIGSPNMLSDAMFTSLFLLFVGYNPQQTHIFVTKTYELFIRNLTA